jgi:hypothetical protein
MIDATSKVAFKSRNNGEDPSIVLAKRLKFEKPEYWMAFGSCLYTYTDSSMAIRGFFKLSKNNSDVDLNYLKLFGFLNAVYLQLGSIKKLMEVVKLPNKTMIEKNLKKHEIIHARNILASHTLDYLEGENIPNTFTIHQYSIEGHGVTFMNNTTLSLISYNFDILFDSWINESRNILILIIRKFIKSIYKPNQEKIKHYETRLVNLGLSN